jgi:polysaccharide deacetylase family protein (PEP-CTERM system associated)
MKNALSVDVEEYFQVSAFGPLIRQSDWSTHESRIDGPLHSLLDLFDRFESRATFFVVGWTAEKHPDLVREIHRRGHEVACHSFAHQLIYNMTPDEFRADLTRCKKILEDITGEAVLGFRAPSYSVTSASFWALDILIEEGFRYDSSIFPIRHDRYGVPSSPRFPHAIEREGGEILEFPLSTVRLFGKNVPIAGGGYMRLFPYLFMRWGLKKINREEGQPAIVYFHPWEIDPAQPRQPVGPLTRFRHYHNLRHMQEKIRRLLEDFSFRPVREVLQDAMEHLGKDEGLPLSEAVEIETQP